MKKIDLHMHTTYSDGTLSLQELLRLASEKNLDVISITDHNKIDAYFELEQNDYSSIFSGKIIKGVEIYSYYKGITIEFLVYDYDLHKMKEFLERHYNKDWNTNRINSVLAKLKEVAKQKGMLFDENFTIKANMGESASFFRHLKSFKENHKYFSKELLSGQKSFFRTEVCNKNSDFYIDYGVFYIKPDELMNFVTAQGGKIFLAHLYEYNLENPIELVDYVKSLGITGIECYYPTFTKVQCEFLLDYTTKHNLLASGGSDFHGATRPNELGVLNNSAAIDLGRFYWVELALHSHNNFAQNYTIKALPLITKTPVTTLTVNTVLVTNNNSAILFDPSVSVEELHRELQQKKVLAVVLTHAHWDHILELEACLKEFNCPLYLHPNAVEKLTDSHLNCADTHSLDMVFNIPTGIKIITLKEQTGVLVLGDFTLNYYYTPGHSNDSISFVLDNNLICGDSIRLNKLARINLPTSNEKELQQSHQFFNSLNKNMMVYNGHDTPSQLSNCFLWQEDNK